MTSALRVSMEMGARACLARASMTGRTRRHLLLGGDRLGARPRRFPADVEDVGTLGLQLQAVRDGRLRIEIPAAVGEAVRRDVDDAHEAGPVEREAGNGRARPLQPLQRGRPICACATREIGRGGKPAADRLALALGELGGGEDQVHPPRNRKPEGRADRGASTGRRPTGRM